jgi:hypothetical protein
VLCACCWAACRRARVRRRPELTPGKLH